MTKYNQVACFATDGVSRRYLTVADLWEYQEKTPSLFRLSSVQLFQNPIKKFEPFMYEATAESAVPRRSVLRSAASPRIYTFCKVRIERLNCKDCVQHEPLTKPEEAAYVPGIKTALGTLMDTVTQVGKRAVTKLAASFVVTHIEGSGPVEVWLVGCGGIEFYQRGLRVQRTALVVCREDKKGGAWLPQGREVAAKADIAYYGSAKDTANSQAGKRRREMLRRGSQSRQQTNARFSRSRFHSVCRSRASIAAAPSLLAKNLSGSDLRPQPGGTEILANAKSGTHNRARSSRSNDPPSAHPQERAQFLKITGVAQPTNCGNNTSGTRMCVFDRIVPAHFRTSHVTPTLPQGAGLVKRSPSVQTRIALARGKFAGRYYRPNPPMGNTAFESYCRRMSIQSKPLKPEKRTNSCYCMEPVQRSSVGGAMMRNSSGVKAEESANTEEDAGGSLLRPVFNVMIKGKQNNASQEAEMAKAGRRSQPGKLTVLAQKRAAPTEKSTAA